MKQAQICRHLRYRHVIKTKERDPLTIDERRNGYYQYILSLLRDAAHVGFIGHPVIVGDDPEDRKWLCDKLEEDGFRVMPFGDEAPLNQFVLPVAE